MQEKKRRSKRSLLLLASVVALAVLALVPASAMAVTNILTSTLTLTPAGTPGQGGVNWANTGSFSGDFEAFYNGVLTPTAGISNHGFAYWVDGGTGQFVAGETATVPFTFLTNGVHTIRHAADTTQTVTTPPDPYEPPTNTMIGVDMGGDIFGGNPVWSWTLSPVDPGGDLTSPALAEWYGDVPVDFLATASDPGGSGIVSAFAEWTNLTTSTAGIGYDTSPPNLIHTDGVAIDGNPYIFEVTGTVTVPNKITYLAEPLLSNTAAYSTTVSLSATDVAGNIGLDSFIVNHDVWPPVTTDSVDPIGADTFAGYTAEDVTVTFHAADNLSGVDYTEYIVKTSTTTVPPATPAMSDTGTHGSTVTITETAPVGPVYVFYRSVDKAVPANMEQWHLVRVYIDNVAPIVGPAEGFPTWWINHGDQQQDGDSNGHEFFDLLLTASDFNSGLGLFGGVDFRMLTWLPPIYLDWTAYTDGITLFVDRSASATDGIFPLDFRATDMVGNVATGGIDVKIDTRAPVTDGASDWVNGLVPYVLSATDQTVGAGVAATIYRVDQSTPWLIHEATPTVGPTLDTNITLTGAQASTHTIDFGSVDAALPYDFPLATWDVALDGPTYAYGNLEGVSWQWSVNSQGFEAFTGYKTRSVRLDITAPTVMLANPVNPDWQQGPATLNFTGSDVGSGYDYTEWSTDNGATWIKGEVAQIGGNGVITVLYRGVDNVGIKSATQSTTVSVATRSPRNAAKNASVKKGHKATIKFKVTAVTPKASVNILIRKLGKTYMLKRYSQVTTNKWVTRSFTVNIKKGKYLIRIDSVDLAGNVQTVRGQAYLTVK